MQFNNKSKTSSCYITICIFLKHYSEIWFTICKSYESFIKLFILFIRTRQSRIKFIAYSWSVNLRFTWICRRNNIIYNYPTPFGGAPLIPLTPYPQACGFGVWGRSRAVFFFYYGNRWYINLLVIGVYYPSDPPKFITITWIFPFSKQKLWLKKKRK